MAGHSKWANIQHRKGRQDEKRGRVWTRLIREIMVAARTGGGDLDANPRLRLAVEKHTWLLDAGLPRALAGVAAWTPLVVFEMALLALASRWAAIAMLGLLLPAALLITYVAW